MEFQKSSNPKYTRDLVIKGREIDVFAAATRERIHWLSVKGESGAATYFDARAAQWPQRSKPEATERIHVRDFGYLIRLLTEFHENTDRAISVIPHVTREPAFLNDKIPERKLLGNWALHLSEKVSSEAEKIDIEEQLRKAVSEIDDDISRLLGEGGLDPET